MAPKESEKKLINEKVAKVREIVDNATTNDIIMVLHSFDLDVTKTIQAFCEDGAASILGDWQTSGGVSVTAAKKKKNKKNKNASAVAATASETVATPSTAAVQPVQTKIQAQTTTPRQESSTVTKPSNNASKPAANVAVVNDPLSTAFKNLRTALNERENTLKQILASNPKVALSLDTSSLLRSISSFGGNGNAVSNGIPQGQKTATVSPPPAAGPIKHATSQSSITSSVGADSGVNLSPTHKDDKKSASKTTTVINNGGLQMTSNGLSAEQLAALQQTLQLSLAARGLDASVLTSSENVNRRPRPNKTEGKKGGKNQKEQPKLSIL